MSPHVLRTLVVPVFFLLTSPIVRCGRYAVFDSKTNSIYEFCPGNLSCTLEITPDMNTIKPFQTLSDLPLAVIDMKEAQDKPEKVAAQIVEAMETVGFMYLKNIPDYDEDKLFNQTKWFFDLPIDVKRQVTRHVWNKANNVFYRGFFPVIPEWTSYKESFEIGGCNNITKRSKVRTIRDTLYENNVWPNSPDSVASANFRKSMEEYFLVYHRLSLDVLRLVELGLGLKKSRLTSMFESNPLSTLRLIHYPPRPLQHTPKSATDGNLVLLCDKHGDAGFFTFLTTFHYHGLQMQDSDNNWINIPPVKNALIVNIGLNMAKLTAGRLKPTIHRVIDLGISRYSVPFFLEPHFDADMSNSLFGTPLEGTAKNLKYGMWLKNNSAQYAENAHTDWGVPEELVSDYQTNSHVNDEL